MCTTPEYVLDTRYMDEAKKHANVTVMHDIDAAYAGANIVYAKSWGALPYFGRWADEKPIRDAHKHFIVDEPKMALTGSSERGGEQGYFSHCLPLRRDVKATTGVVTGPRSLVIEEAENRLHVQKAVMRRLVDAKGGSS
jgi:N-acetylornithine carbamoyltransferase